MLRCHICFKKFLSKKGLKYHLTEKKVPCKPALHDDKSTLHDDEPPSKPVLQDDEPPSKPVLQDDKPPSKPVLQDDEFPTLCDKSLDDGLIEYLVACFGDPDKFGNHKCPKCSKAFSCGRVLHNHMLPLFIKRIGMMIEDITSEMDDTETSGKYTRITEISEDDDRYDLMMALVHAIMAQMHYRLYDSDFASSKQCEPFSEYNFALWKRMGIGLKNNI